VIGDHFARQFARIPALLAAASATSQLRVTCTVFDNDYRDPAALAKEAATLDVLSGGRFELRPHPPIFIGGGGQRLLSVAARQANIVGILNRASPGGGLDRSEETDACVAQKIGWVRQAAGDRFDQLELAVLIWEVAVTDNPRAAAEAIAAKRSRPVDQVLESPYFLIGSIDAIVDKALELRERHGVSYISVFPSDTETFAPVVARLKAM
jgi:alkanesulfonate monooxygenase SsuD/methylene tetrahydromethanopterin reductase-like flavin-dependent oxidoreductase (luciferase family)